MKDWFSWATNSKLKAAADFTMNGGRLLQEDARFVVAELVEEGKRLTKEYVGNKYYGRHFPSNRHGGPWKDGQPIGLVDHYTAGITARGTLRWFSSRDREPGIGTSSAHFVMDRNGTPIVVVDPLTTIAWHARKDSYTHIGIEHVNAGLLRKNRGRFLYMDKHSYPKSRSGLPQKIGARWWEPYTTAQIVNNIVLKRWLLQATPTLQQEHFVDHEMVDPKRKTDCGPLWPLAELNDLVFSMEPITGMKWLEKTDMLQTDVREFQDEVTELLRV